MIAKLRGPRKGIPPQGIVMGITDATDGWFDPGFGQALGIADGDVLRSPVTDIARRSPKRREYLGIVG